MPKEEESNIISEEESEEVGEDEIVLPKAKIALAKKILQNIKENNERLISLFGGFLSEEDENRIALAEIIDSADDGNSNVVEGVFDGQNMIGPDGKEYSVPQNYASKSKLVEGDFLKLTITDRGIFVYKQTKPAERERLMGSLEKDEEGNFFVLGENGRKWRVLTASITYFKGAPGDMVAVLIPKGGGQWGAVDNIIKSIK